MPSTIIVMREKMLLLSLFYDVLSFFRVADGFAGAEAHLRQTGSRQATCREGSGKQYSVWGFGLEW